MYEYGSGVFQYVYYNCMYGIDPKSWLGRSGLMTTMLWFRVTSRQRGILVNP